MALPQNLWVTSGVFCGCCALSFLGMGASLKAVGFAGGVPPSGATALSVSSFGYPSVGCSPAEPLMFHANSLIPTYFRGAGKPILFNKQF